MKVDHKAKGFPKWIGSNEKLNRFTFDVRFTTWHEQWPFACIEHDASIRLKEAIRNKMIHHAEMDMEWATGNGTLRWWSITGDENSADTMDLDIAIGLGIDQVFEKNKVPPIVRKPEAPEPPSL